MPTQKKAHMLRNWSKRDEHLRYVVSYQFTASNDPLLLPAIAALRTRFMGSEIKSPSFIIYAPPLFKI